MTTLMRVLVSMGLELRELSYDDHVSRGMRMAISD